MKEELVKKILGIIIKADENGWEWIRIGEELDIALNESQKVCPECDGSGKPYKHTSSTPEGMQSGKCPICNGTGKVPSTPASEEMELITCPVDKTLRNYKGCDEGCEFYKSCETEMLKTRIHELEILNEQYKNQLTEFEGYENRA